MKKSTIIIAAISLLVLGVLIGRFAFQGKNIADNAAQSTEVAAETKVEHWTCSMHPQIDMPEPGDCPICGMDLIPMDEAGSNSNPLVFEMSEDAVKLSNIQTVVVGQSTQGEGSQLRLSGKIQADESRSASLVTHIPGRIEKLYVSYTGETVRKGQKLARLYSPDLITAQKELLESKMMENVNPKLFEATLNKLKYWKITDNQIDKILESKEIQESFIIYAEHSGVVSKRRVSVGDHLMEGGILFDVQNLDNLWVLFDVYEENLPNIKLGDEIVFRTPAVAGKDFVGKVSFINPVINPNTRAATVRVVVKNGKQSLKPEMFVTGDLKIAASSHTQLTIPKSAVMWTGTRSVVYIKVPNSTVPSFEFREITLGDASGSSYQVIDGLEEGEEVVIKGAFVIDASAQLNNQASMMNRFIEGNEMKKMLPNYTQETPEEFKKQLENLNEKYLVLKDHLVDTDADKTAKSTQEILEALSSVDMLLLKGKAHEYWMEKLNQIEGETKSIAQTNDIEAQRTMFVKLSESLIETVKVFGVDQQVVYVEFCPMANNNEGAFWLSEETQIRNPYFGEQMMQCGSVEDTLDHNFHNPELKTNSAPMQGHNH